MRTFVHGILRSQPKTHTVVIRSRFFMAWALADSLPRSARVRLKREQEWFSAPGSLRENGGGGIERNGIVIRPKYFDPMSAITEAIRMFMEEMPEDALCVLQNAQREYFDWLQYTRDRENLEDTEEVENLIEEAVCKALRRRDAMEVN